MKLEHILMFLDGTNCILYTNMSLQLDNLVDYLPFTANAVPPFLFKHTLSKPDNIALTDFIF